MQLTETEIADVTGRLNRDLEGAGIVCVVHAVPGVDALIAPFRFTREDGESFDVICQLDGDDMATLTPSGLDAALRYFARKMEPEIARKHKALLRRRLRGEKRRESFPC